MQFLRTNQTAILRTREGDGMHACLSLSNFAIAMLKNAWRVCAAMLVLSVTLASCVSDKISNDSLGTLDITKDQTWRRGSTVSIAGRVTVVGATLRVEPGVTIEFAEDGQLVVGGSSSGNIVMEGTLSSPIVLQSASKDKPWLGIQILSTSRNSRISNCEVRHAGSSSTPAMRIANLNFPIDNLSIAECPGVGLQIDAVDRRALARLSGLAIHTTNGHAISGCVEMLALLGRNSTLTAARGFGIELVASKVDVSQFAIPDMHVPYYVMGSISIDAQSLDLGAGNVFRFARNGEFDLGSIRPTTVLAQRVVFTSAEENKAPGQWKGITCNSYVQVGSRFDGCTFEAGGGGDPSAGLVLYDCQSVVVRNCRFVRNAGYGIALVSATLSSDSQGNTFVDNEKGDIKKLRGHAARRATR